ncbi:extracellular matrix-binding protein ebh-like [Ostrinia nubilalis]|uniref:extracellular matrix-binding protein ebh-like n=1 Tax=Ostrinia nubilalis TaxID=29057 RepID=UPI00308245DD
MECTQRLECTQDLYDARPERICPEQIGFLGICGVKHPVKRGPNKIGRDPQTCSIVLNLNSISRQHAVINVLNQTEYMLMDLDSANKTKLMDKTLPPYIPHPLKNGDMVQFGDIFGVFRLLEEDTDLPMTQAIDMPETQIPETPVSNKHISKANRIPVTTIPESPDVSDKDESFIVPSQPKRDKCFRNSNSHFVKPSSKVISIQPIGTNKIDNVYWSSSKRSLSLNSQFNDSDSLNDSTLSNKTGKQSSEKSIFEMETQPPVPLAADESTDSIYTADTQVPAVHTPNKQVPNSIYTENTQVPSSINTENTQIPSSIHVENTQDFNSIHNACTQAPTSIHTENTQAPSTSPSIHNINTQLPPSSHLPEVCKINNQQDMQIDLYSSSNKQNNNDSIFDAETQVCAQEVVPNQINKKTELGDKSPNKINASGEEILFEEMECDDFDNNFESQALLPTEKILDLEKCTSDEKKSDNTANKMETHVNKVKKPVIIESDSSTDCEDVDMVPPKHTEKQGDDEDVTDCEDLFDDVPKKPTKELKEKVNNNSFEDMLTQVICEDNTANKTNQNENFEDMLTQVIVPEDETPSTSKKPNTSQVSFEELPTQIIVDENEDVIIADKPIPPKDNSFEDLPTQVISNKPTPNNVAEDFVSPFKIPLMSPLKAKRKNIKVVTPKTTLDENKMESIVIPDDDNYYAATQDILEDLCTQPADISPHNKNKATGPSNIPDDDFLPSSVEEYAVGKRFPHLENNLSPRKNLNRSIDSSDGDENVNNFVSKLSSQQIREVIGVESVDKIKRVPSDSSDLELTPKKIRPIRFMDIDLPNSQEIKTGVSMHSRTPVTESSSESEVENDSEECTPILFRKKKKPKVDAKIDLTKMFAAESLPTRVITRVRKPTNKYQNDETNTLSRNILKPKYLTEQEEEIDKDIITENISRLKSKSEKSKNKEANKDSGRETKSKNLDQKVSKAKTESKIKEKDTNNTNKIDKYLETTKNHRNDKKSTKSDKACSKDDVIDVEPLQETSKHKEKSTNDKKIEAAKKKESNRRSKNDKTNVSDANATIAVSPKDPSVSQITNVSIEINTSSVSTRSTRNKRKVDESKDKCSVNDNDSQSEKKSKSSRKQNLKTIEIDLTDEPVEVRRSRRQKPNEKKETKDKVEKVDNKSLDKTDSDKSLKPVTRRGRPPKHGRPVKAEQSTIYSLSSESGVDSPMNVKRSAPDNLDPPSPKRTRSAANSRATPARMNKTQYVLFTAFPSEEVKAKLENLGAVVVSDVSACSVVLTLSIRRTFKLLCAVGLGRPVVGPDWVQACVDSGAIVDPWLYILKDEVAEKRFQFSLQKTLVGSRNFLKGFNLSSTPKVMPCTEEMKLIVECSGGTWKEQGPQWICVSCNADKALWPALRRSGATIVSTEFILGGVLRQRADITNNKL